MRACSDGLKNLIKDPAAYALHASDLVLVRWGHRHTVPFSHVARSPTTPMRPAVGRADGRSCWRQSTSLLEGVHFHSSRLTEPSALAWLRKTLLKYFINAGEVPSYFIVARKLPPYFGITGNRQKVPPYFITARKLPPYFGSTGNRQNRYRQKMKYREPPKKNTAKLKYRTVFVRRKKRYRGRP